MKISTIAFIKELSLSLSLCCFQNFFTVKTHTVLSGEELSQGLYVEGNTRGVHCSIQSSFSTISHPTGALPLKLVSTHMQNNSHFLCTAGLNDFLIHARGSFSIGIIYSHISLQDKLQQRPKVKNVWGTFHLYSKVASLYIFKTPIRIKLKMSSQ